MGHIADQIRGAKLAKGLENVPNILTIDIETSPNLAHVWGLWQQNVGLNQLMESGEVICFAAKWYGQKDVQFYSNHHDGHDVMVQAAYDLLHKAEAVVHFNGKRFDIPHLNREMLTNGLGVPSPYKQIDLLQVVKSRFKFPSNKLDYVSRELGLGSKTSHTGHDLWVRCLAGDDKAWTLMRKYNVQDVRLTEKLYDTLRPWIKGHPHIGFYADADALTCDKCGSKDLHRDGTYTAQVIRYTQYRCGNCGGWVRAGVHSRQAHTRGIA